MAWRRRADLLDQRSHPTAMTASPQNQTTEDLDSDNPAGEAATVTQGAAPL